MPFLSSEVFDARRKAMSAFMDARGLDALVFTTDDWVQYATNFHLDVRPWERPVMAVVPRNGDPFCLMNELSTHHLRMAGERGQLWVEEIHLYDEHRSGANARRLVTEWPAIAAELLADHGLAKGRLGVDSGGGPLPQVKETLGAIEVLPLGGEMRRLRWVKHPEELALLRQIADLTDWTQARYAEAMRPGRLWQATDSAMHAAFFEEAAERFPGEHAEVRGYTLSGPASCSPHGSGAPTGARFETGHGVVNIVVARLNGMVVENERTWFIGPPSDRQAEAYAAALAANEAAIAQMTPGTAVQAIEDAARAEIETAGFGACIRHRTGHGIGILGHEFPEDMAFNDRALEAGEVYSAEPGIYIWGLGGFRIDDTVIVGATPEVVTRYPKDLASITLPG